MQAILRGGLAYCFAMACTGEVHATEKAQGFLLQFEKYRHFQVALENELFAVYRSDSQVFTSADNSSFFIQSTYNSTAKEADLGFGSLHVPTALSERVPFSAEIGERRIRGISYLDDWIVFLDTSKRQFVFWDTQTKVWQRPVDLVLDLLKPPADAKGEPGRNEIQEMRNRVNRSYQQIMSKSVVLVGLTRIPDFWRDRDGSQFLVLTRIPGANLLTVRCDVKNRNYCQAIRSCFLKGIDHKAMHNFSGIAVDQKRKEILIGSVGTPSIRRFNAPSCYRVQPVAQNGQIQLPNQLRGLSNFAIDSERNLWIALAEPDIYNNASLYRYDSSAWTNDN